MVSDKTLRTLVVDDSEDDAFLIIQELKKCGYKPVFERVETAVSMKRSIEEKQWDIVLCDYKMPEFSAPEAIDLLKKSNIDTPVIIVSGAIGEETAVNCMHMGARDYVMKDKLSRLCPAITRELEEAESRIKEKHAKIALIRSEDRFRAQYQVSPIATFTWEKIGDDFVLLECNDAALTLAGESFKKYVGESAGEIYSRKNKVLNDIRRCFEEKNVIRRETKSTHFLPGRDIICTYAFVPDNLVMVHVEDVTERRLAEKNLIESEARYRSLFDRSLDNIFIIDYKGNFIDANNSALTQYGYGKEDLSALNIASFMDSDQMKLSRKIMREIRKTGAQKELSELKLRYRDKDIYMETQGSAVMLNGKSEAVQIIARDITRRKKAEAELNETLESLRKSLGSIVGVLASALEFRDPYTACHQSRSTNLACAIALEMGLELDRIEGLRMAGSVHDIGKLSIPAEILAKPKRLNKLEYSLIQEHPQSGYEILKNVESPWPLAQIVYQHHERLDGSGYPLNLKGDEIIVEARILGVADVVEAMCSHRPYRPSLGISAALEEIEKNIGITYDADAARACIKLFREKEYQIEPRL